MTLPKRFCLAFVGSGQCLRPATHMCDDGTGFEWYACSEHARVGYEHDESPVAKITPIAQWFKERGLL